MDQGHPATRDLQLALAGQLTQLRIVIAPHRLHGRDAAKPFQGFRATDVAGVQDQLAAGQTLVDAVGKVVQELLEMGVRDHANAHARQTLASNVIGNST